ncbi:hypothetical protein [Aeromicrobium sp.]|uniref:hypothetical protein n=1 Tax=Aeromicrobium sp. TaxID=1871063 RepID=UPI003D6A02EF
MEQPPFPVALVVLVVLFGSLALWSDVLWIKVIAGLGTFFVAAAAVFQSLPKRSPQDPIDDEPPE